MSKVVLTSGREFVEYCGKQVEEDFFLNETLTKNYEKIYMYLFNHEVARTKFKLNPNVGLWICGLPGSGKSIAFKVMRQMILNSDLPVTERFQIVTYKHIEREYKKFDNEIFEQYGAGHKSTLVLDEFFNDLSMTGANFGGKKISLVEELINDRDEIFSSLGIKTHLGSNLARRSIIDPDNILKTKPDTPIYELKSLVDFRTCDRLNHMFNHLHWEGTSLRKI